VLWITISYHEKESKMLLMLNGRFHPPHNTIKQHQ